MLSECPKATLTTFGFINLDLGSISEIVVQRNWTVVSEDVRRGRFPMEKAPLRLEMALLCLNEGELRYTTGGHSELSIARLARSIDAVNCWSCSGIRALCAFATAHPNELNGTDIFALGSIYERERAGGGGEGGDPMIRFTPSAYAVGSESSLGASEFGCGACGDFRYLLVRRAEETAA